MTRFILILMVTVLAACHGEAPAPRERVLQVATMMPEIRARARPSRDRVQQRRMGMLTRRNSRLRSRTVRRTTPPP